MRVGRKIKNCANKQVWVTPYGDALLLKVEKNGETWQVTDELPGEVCGWLMRQIGFGDHKDMPAFPKPAKAKAKAKPKAKPKSK